MDNSAIAFLARHFPVPVERMRIKTARLNYFDTTVRVVYWGVNEGLTIVSLGSDDLRVFVSHDVITLCYQEPEGKP